MGTGSSDASVDPLKLGPAPFQIGSGLEDNGTALFQRVHRSTIVNLDQVRQVKPHTNGECFLVLDSGAQVKVSRSYRDVVARFVH